MIDALEILTDDSKGGGGKEEKGAGRREEGPGWLMSSCLLIKYGG